LTIRIDTSILVDARVRELMKEESSGIRRVEVEVSEDGTVLAVTVRLVAPSPRGPGLARRALPERSSCVDTVGRVVELRRAS
jgi:hypothetical protein